MIRILRRVRLLTALVLLLSGGAYSAASAQGLTCARKHVPTEAWTEGLLSAIGLGLDGVAAAATDAARVAQGDPHLHDRGSLHAPTAPCGGPAIEVERALTPSTPDAPGDLPAAELPPSGRLVQPPFRPPRLS